MSTLTRVPDVLEALVVLFRDATGLQVLDGPVIGEVMAEAICVGLSPDQSEPGYQVEVVRQQGMGAPRYVEEWTVSSLLSLTSGETDAIATLRRRAGEVLGQIDAAARAAHTGDAWQRLAFGARMQWLPLKHPSGSTVSVFFDMVGASLL